MQSYIQIYSLNQLLAISFKYTYVEMQTDLAIQKRRKTKTNKNKKKIGWLYVEGQLSACGTWADRGRALRGGFSKGS